jgi:opacity protein-like surface antigen
MKRVLLTLALAAALATPAAAGEHVGPKAIFAGKTPQEAAATIAQTCADRGFAVRQISDTDVVCQGGDMWRSVVQFRADPPANPADKPQIYHRFVASSVEGGALVKERSVVVWSLRGNVQEVTPRLVMARVINERVAELYRAIGAEPQPAQ